jgi:hypothetical protein
MLMYQWVLIPLDSLQTLRLSQQWRKTILEPKRTWDWVFDMNERKWADFLKYNVLFRALVPEIRFGKGVPNQFQGFKLFRNVEPELVFCKGKKGNLGGEKEPWGVGWVFFLNFRHVSIFPWVTQAFHCLGSFKHACVTCSSFHVEYFLKNYFCRPRSYSHALREADVKKSNFSLGVPLLYDTYVI